MWYNETMLHYELLEDRNGGDGKSISAITNPNSAVNRSTHTITKYMRSGIAAMILGILAMKGCRADGDDQRVQDARELFPTHEVDEIDFNEFAYGDNKTGKQTIFWYNRHYEKQYMKWRLNFLPHVQHGKSGTVIVRDWNTNSDIFVRSNKITHSKTGHDPVRSECADFIPLNAIIKNDAQ